VFAEHFGEGGFPSTDISCYCNMLWFSSFGHNILIGFGVQRSDKVHIHFQ
jgi:hypothetical protein